MPLLICRVPLPHWKAKTTSLHTSWVNGKLIFQACLLVQTGEPLNLETGVIPTSFTPTELSQPSKQSLLSSAGCNASHSPNKISLVRHQPMKQNTFLYTSIDSPAEKPWNRCKTQILLSALKSICTTALRFQGKQTGRLVKATSFFTLPHLPVALSVGTGLLCHHHYYCLPFAKALLQIEMGVLPA